MAYHYSLNYFKKAAWKAGVPELWIEDAAQDIAIRVWQSDLENKNIVVKRAAIDAARKYGQYNRFGNARIIQVELEDASNEYVDPLDTWDQIIDFQAAFKRLSPSQQYAMQRMVNNQQLCGSDYSHIYKSRQRLRLLINSDL